MELTSSLPRDVGYSVSRSKLVAHIEENPGVTIDDVELAEALTGPYLSRSDLGRLASLVVLGPNAAAQFSRQWGSSGPPWDLSLRWANKTVATNPRAALASVVSYQWWFGTQGTLPIEVLAGALGPFGNAGLARVAISIIETAHATRDGKYANDDVLECFHLASKLCES